MCGAVAGDTHLVPIGANRILGRSTLPRPSTIKEHTRNVKKRDFSSWAYQDLSKSLGTQESASTSEASKVEMHEQRETLS